MRWHAKDRVNDGKLRHLADGAQWRAINHSYKRMFSNKIRNIRFGLSTDGMNPFNMVSSNHSTLAMYETDAPYDVDTYPRAKATLK